MAGSRKQKAAVDVTALVSQARATLEADGVVKLKELGPTAERARVTDELRAMGFEVMKTVVRRPLEAQLSEALERGAFIPLKSIATFVRGATVAERQAAVSKLIAQGRALKVLREKVEMLVPSGTNVLSREEVTALLRALGNLSKLLTKVSKQRQASVLRADLVEQIQAAFPELLSQARTVERNAVSVGEPGLVQNLCIAAVIRARRFGRSNTACDRIGVEKPSPRRHAVNAADAARHQHHRKR